MNCVVSYLSDLNNFGLKLLRLHCETFFFRAFHEIQFQDYFMKHETLSWNAFTLVSKFHCVCFSSIKKMSLEIKKNLEGLGVHQKKLADLFSWLRRPFNWNSLKCPEIVNSVEVGNANSQHKYIFVDMIYGDSF